MIKTIYPNKGGMGLILENAENIKDFTTNETIKVAGKTINIGNKTSLNNYFDKSLEYCGLLKNETSKCMVFYLGDDTDLFSELQYYKCLYLIAERRLVDKFKEGTAKDFNWINNQWK